MADTFERVKEIVLRARELSGERRAAYLTEVCGEDAALREEVQALLDHEGWIRTGSSAGSKRNARRWHGWIILPLHACSTPAQATTDVRTS